MTEQLPSLATIPYGPGHATAMRELLGSNSRVIATALYEQPVRRAYALEDGRFAIETTTKYGYESRVAIYPGERAWSVAWNATLAAVPDPETDRVSGATTTPCVRRNEHWYCADCGRETMPTYHGYPVAAHRCIAN